MKEEPLPQITLGRLLTGSRLLPEVSIRGLNDLLLPAGSCIVLVSALLIQWLSILNSPLLTSPVYKYCTMMLQHHLHWLGNILLPV